MNSNPLLARIEMSHSLPTLPHILLQLIETCNRREKGVKDLTRIINQDPALSERVLRLVNSAFYSLKQKVNSIEQALLLLGTDAVKNLAVSSSVYQVFRRVHSSEELNLKQFWWHSVSCAVLARLLARRTEYPVPDEAFLSGLLHDIGKFVLWSNFEREYTALLKSSAGSSAKLLAAERGFGLTHAEAGAWLVGRWDLRSFMPDAVRYHHEPPERIADSFPLVRLVWAANLVCPSDPRRQPQHEPAGRAVGLAPSDLKELCEEAQEEVRQIGKSLEIELEPPEQPEGEAARGIAALDRGKAEALTRLVRDYSLLQSISEGFLGASGRAQVLETLRQGLAVLFDLPSALFFRLEGGALVGEPLSGAPTVTELRIPCQNGASLLSRALQSGEVLESLGEKPTIFDEQLSRLLNGEGILCLPLRAEQESLGVLAVGIRDSVRASLAARTTLLRLLANQASLALFALVLQERQTARIREERLAASSTLARRIVHEAHNPLGIISNYLSILSAKLMDNASIQDDLRIVREEIRRVSQIINELASFSTAGTAVREPVDVNSLLSDLVQISQESLWETAAVRVHLQLDPALPPIRSEKNKLKQVFLNLLKNASEAMPGGGNLRLETRLRPGEPPAVEVRIRDEGSGIAEEVKASLFEPFVSTKGHEGLGLSIVHGLVKELGGSIDYETGAKGTTFRVELPQG